MVWPLPLATAQEDTRYLAENQLTTRLWSNATVTEFTSKNDGSWGPNWRPLTTSWYLNIAIHNLIDPILAQRDLKGAFSETNKLSPVGRLGTWTMYEYVNNCKQLGNDQTMQLTSNASCCVMFASRPSGIPLENERTWDVRNTVCWDIVKPKARHIYNLKYNNVLYIYALYGKTKRPGRGPHGFTSPRQSSGGAQPKLILGSNFITSKRRNSVTHGVPHRRREVGSGQHRWFPASQIVFRCELSKYAFYDTLWILHDYIEHKQPHATRK